MSNTFKWFIFRHATLRGMDNIAVDIQHEGRDNQTIQITEATYNRFVKLANSGKYNVDILPAEEGVAWELVRCSQRILDYPGIRDAATLPFAPAHQCPVEADGNILFA